MYMYIDSKAAIEGGEILDDRIVEAVPDVWNSQFPGINGFLSTILGQGDASFKRHGTDSV